VPLTSIPVPPVLSLFSNIASLARLSPSPPPQALSLLSLLLSEIPIGALTARASVFWLSAGRATSAIVIPEPATAQAKGALVPPFAQKLCGAFLPPAGGGRELLAFKSGEDREREAAAGRTATAADAAEADAAPERKKSWFEKTSSSSWARKLKAAFAAPAKPGPGRPGQQRLVNTSAVSRDIARGERPAPPPPPERAGRPEAGGSLEGARAFAPFAALAIARWGGGGSYNVAAKRRLPEDLAVSSAEPAAQTFVNALCFSTPALEALWAFLISPSAEADLGYALSSSHATPLSATSLSPAATPRLDSAHQTLAAVMVFASLLSATLMLTDDAEIHDKGVPLPKHQLRRAILLFKRVLFKAVKVDVRGRSDEKDTPFGVALVAACARAMREL
jgi:hypothetical protein